MGDLDALNRELARATWEAGIPGVGTSVLVTRRSRVMTTLALLVALACLSACGAVQRPLAPRQWCADALPGTGDLTICRESQLTCEDERSESQDMGPCQLR